MGKEFLTQIWLQTGFWTFQISNFFADLESFNDGQDSLRAADVQGGGSEIVAAVRANAVPNHKVKDHLSG